jgi:DNA repair protein SbcC/Rad50
LYISKIVLENFQAFDKGEFVLSPNLNILVGVSNVGKSSVARALSLVLFNQWDKSWCKFGAKYCRVSVLTDSGVEVVREKGDKVNRYILRIPSQPEQVFESFGTGVPEQVQQALHIHEVQVDTTDKLNLNLAGQMDALFLLSQTGSYRAKVLGKLSGATFLDHAIRELNKDKRQVTAEKNSKDLEIVELQAQASKLEAVESYSTVISDLESKLTSLAVAQQRLERIRSLFERVTVLKAAWLAESKKSDLLGPFPLVMDSLSKLVARVDKNKALSSLYSRIVTFKLTFGKQSKLNELLTPLNLSSILTLTEKVSKFRIKEDLAEKLLNRISQVALVKMDLERAEKQHKEAAQQYATMLKDAGVCPICNRSTVEGIK